MGCIFIVLFWSISHSKSFTACQYSHTNGRSFHTNPVIRSYTDTRTVIEPGIKPRPTDKWQPARPPEPQPPQGWIHTSLTQSNRISFHSAFVWRHSVQLLWLFSSNLIWAKLSCRIKFPQNSQDPAPADMVIIRHGIFSGNTDCPTECWEWKLIPSLTLISLALLTDTVFF